jgi:ABC-type dipeptide/oligopeptide/nickel transport system ATPase component
MLLVVCCVASLCFYNPYFMLVVPMVIYKGKPKPHAWARWMVGRTMRKNNNNLVAIVGKTGSGKTWAGISICEIMSEIDGVPFTIDHIVFSLTELMELINSGKLKRGSKIVFDEPQISIGAREFQSEANKVFNFLVSTFRHRNFTLFFCTPFEKLLDKSTRRLFHSKFETLSINPNKQTCRIKPRYLEYSDFKDDPYRKQLLAIVKESNGKTSEHKVAYWDVPKPSQALIDQYETKKRAFTDRLNKNIYNRLLDFDKSKGFITSDNTPVVERKPLTATQERVMKVLANTLVSNRYEKASEVLGISIGSIHQNKVLAEKKGYRLEEFRENG